MPVNYSKFDHIEDSDDDRPDPKALAVEEHRRQVAEQLQQTLAEGRGQREKAEEGKAPHQKDRFAYGEGDCQKLAQELLRTCLNKSPSVKVGNGVVSVTGVEKVEGDATMFLVRGQLRHTWDFSFKVKWTYQWMGANFDEGARRAEGTVTICEFTDASTLKDDKTPPIIRKAWTDKGGIDQAKQKEVEKSLGGKPWPPEDGTLLAGIVKALEVFEEELPNQTTAAQQNQKKQREEAAQEDEEEFREGGGVRIEELPDNR